MTRAQEWFRCYRPRRPHDVRLFCFPHAGGSASSYRPLAALMPEAVEVHSAQYPGREDRLTAPLISDMDEIAAQLADAVGELGEGPFALFGHSLGAAIAYEVTLLLERRGMRPVHLIVSGREPPQHAKLGCVHLQGEDGLRAELMRVSDSNRHLIDDPELWNLVRPIIENDYRLVETYRPRLDRVVQCNMTAFVGDADSDVTPEEAADWKSVAGGKFDLRVFPGDHFYLAAHRQAVVEAVAALLRRRSSLPPEVCRSRWPSTP